MSGPRDAWLSKNLYLIKNPMLQTCSDRPLLVRTGCCCSHPVCLSLPHSVTSGPSWPKICRSSSKTSIHQRLPGYTSNWRCSCLSLMWPEFKTQRRRKTLISPQPSSFLSFPSLCYLTACKSFFSQRFRGLFIPPLSLILLLGQLALTVNDRLLLTPQHVSDWSLISVSS